MSGRSFWPSSQAWHIYWLAKLVALIAVIQLFISFIILGIHVAIVVIGIVLCFGAAPWFIMGFICWAFFLSSWISIFCVTCCNRSSVGCATYTAIKNILTFVFAAVLIDFDRRVINDDPSTLGYVYGNNIDVGCFSSSSYSSVDRVNLMDISRALTKGQLAGGVIMLVSALAFISIYIYTYIRALQYDRRSTGVPAPLSNQRSQPQQPWSSHPINPGPYSTPYGQAAGNDLVCPKCGTVVATSNRF